MPKPNRYMGNGKVYPNGTVMGVYIMRNGHWVHRESPVGRTLGASNGPERGSSFMVWLSFVMIVLVLLFAFGLLTGCQVNVVNVVHSDIGVQAVSETLKETY